MCSFKYFLFKWILICWQSKKKLFLEDLNLHMWVEAIGSSRYIQKENEYLEFSIRNPLVTANSMS